LALISHFVLIRFAKGYEEFAKTSIPEKDQAKFLMTRGKRATLRAIVDLLHTFDSSFLGEDIIKELATLEPNFGKIAQDLITRLLDSDFMEMIGETIGTAIGDVLKVMADLVSGAEEFLNAGKFAQGFGKGLDKGKVFDSINKIFAAIFSMMGKALLTAITKLPGPAALYIGITAVLPAAIAALGNKDRYRPFSCAWGGRPYDPSLANGDEDGGCSIRSWSRHDTRCDGRNGSRRPYRQSSTVS
jgi:hypothetical protein